MQLFLDVDGADAGGRENLVAGEDEEVGAHLLHVDRNVGDGLGAVDDHPGAVALGHLRHFVDRQDRAQAVRGLRERDDLRARPEQLLILLEHDFAAVVHGNDAQHGAFLLGDHLPGHDLGVVLEHREHDFVARLQELPAVGVGDEIDAFGRAADEDDFLDRRCTEERLHLFAGLFVGVGRAGGQRVGAAMDVRIVVLVKVRNRVDHALRLLRGGGVVEPGQRLAVDLLPQDGKVLADRRHIEGPRRRRFADVPQARAVAAAAAGLFEPRLAARHMRLTNLLRRTPTCRPMRIGRHRRIGHDARGRGALGQLGENAFGVDSVGTATDGQWANCGGATAFAARLASSADGIRRERRRMRHRGH